MQDAPNEYVGCDASTASLVNASGLDSINPVYPIPLQWYPSAFDFADAPALTELDGNPFMQSLTFGEELTTDSNPLPVPFTLQVHDTDTNSVVPACLCGNTFSRKDALNRHIQTASRRSSQAFLGSDTSDLYPCTLCDKHRGTNAFKRRDHLRQHLGVKGLHKMNKAAVDKYIAERH
ncbi:hypothetical protein QBC34DRAFT_180018 [Podospora aff. communis PSN243]|uniref:C2H2-type domain-containing protein n=1 Tax=Podospora aff. communis PSN243 TaxID=3040156 RepID=A0AAV9G9R5_9PEZI|nr:hypothetical protein QBC34DRAFT_180018 [Podospora aff. communis PSN243]